MKVISIYKGINNISTIIEENLFYQLKTIDKNNKLISSKKYFIKKYGNRENFANILGKFNSYSKILKKEINIDKLNYEKLLLLYKELKQKNEI